ncbi:hypothetical protein [Photorhabdus heterorhabditis]|uniref:Lipoprotein n=1 Tax=Photorhabdus heterorhabditis TaxID=880156 RepID=A0A5B0WPX0_9GAMM|nr:hypothetical protein [Photorhabdus heterorhabditis]KAA1188285.1 hypothetical protein F0L16_11490 [Photorhabdus heterorhabditis]KOY62397.1 hypothetical protein AM629_08595 [Photorhabdus heterorhabditis]MBS9444059.1 hypothetical protein [Photorhabdus heterorhabditis]
MKSNFFFVLLFSLLSSACDQKDLNRDLEPNGRLYPTGVVISDLGERFTDISSDFEIKQKWLRSNEESPDVFEVTIIGYVNSNQVNSVEYTYTLYYVDGDYDIHNKTVSWLCKSLKRYSKKEGCID